MYIPLNYEWCENLITTVILDVSIASVRNSTPAILLYMNNNYTQDKKYPIMYGWGEY